MMRRKIFMLCVTLVPLSFANATINPIGPFTGQYSEDFETHTQGCQLEISVFGGEGIVRAFGGSEYRVCVACLWGSSIGESITPHRGEMFIGCAGNDLEWVFNTPAMQFGGYFTNLNVGAWTSEDAVAYFFDAEDNLLDQMQVISPYNQWTWNGWMSEVPITRVQIIGLGIAAGSVMLDDMEYSTIPEPLTILMLGLGGLALIRKRTI